MARKIKTVKIELDDKSTKKYTIKELSIQDILDLSQDNSFFKPETANTIKKSQNGVKSAETAADKSFLEEIIEYGTEIEGVMEKICDFKLVDLKPLAPSDIKELYSGFQEVNEVFLDVLKKLGVLKMFTRMLEKHIKNFSKIAAIL